MRFSFLALAATLFFEALVSRRTRGRAIFAACFVLVAGGVGEIVRHDTAIKFATAPIAAPDASSAASASCVEVNIYNSLALRVQLLADALRALPHAGIFGHGLRKFDSMNCLGIGPHVTLLQIIIEFGWVAGIVLLLLVLAALYRAHWLQRPEARFVFMGMVYTALLTLAHGDLPRDGLFFLFLGYLVRIGEKPH